MHTADARKAGETEQRIHLLAAWHEAPCYTDRERAALAWTEHLTEIATKRAPAAIYEALDAQFSKEEQLKLTLMINVINGWNRLAVGLDRKSVVSGKSGSVRVDLGGGRIIKKK